MELNYLKDMNKNNAKIVSSVKGYGKTLVCKRSFQKGEIIQHGYGKVINRQTKHCSIQIKKDLSFLPTKWGCRYWNHSCNPSCKIKTRKDGFPDLVAIRNLKKGEEVTYSYFMTEYKWAEKAIEKELVCLCKAKGCKGKIFSFSELSKEEKIKNKNNISDYLKKGL